MMINNLVCDVGDGVTGRASFLSVETTSSCTDTEMMEGDEGTACGVRSIRWAGHRLKVR